MKFLALNYSDVVFIMLLNVNMPTISLPDAMPYDLSIKLIALYLNFRCMPLQVPQFILPPVNLPPTPAIKHTNNATKKSAEFDLNYVYN